MLSKCGAGEESSLDSEGLKPVNNKGNQPWIFIGRSEAEFLAVWPPDVKSRLIGKDPDSGKDWGQEKEVIEDKVIGWNQRLKRHEFMQTLGDSEGQGSLARLSLLNAATRWPQILSLRFWKIDNAILHLFILRRAVNSAGNSYSGVGRAQTTDFQNPNPIPLWRDFISYVFVKIGKEVFGIFVKISFHTSLSSVL